MIKDSNTAQTNYNCNRQISSASLQTSQHTTIQKLFMNLSLQLIQLQIENHDSNNDDSITIQVSNNYGTVHKIDSISLQRQINQTKKMFISLKKTNPFTFLYEIDNNQYIQEISYEDKSMLSQKNKNSSYACQLKSLRSIIFKIQRKFNKNKQIYNIYGSISPYDIFGTFRKNKKCFSLPIVSNKNGKAQSVGHIKIKTKLNKYSQFQQEFRDKQYFSAKRHNKFSILNAFDKPIVSSAINVKPQYFINTQSSCLDEGNLELSKKLEMLNRQYHHENVSVWQQNRYPSNQIINQCSDEQQME